MWCWEQHCDRVTNKTNEKNHSFDLLAMGSIVFPLERYISMFKTQRFAFPAHCFYGRRTSCCPMIESRLSRLANKTLEMEWVLSFWEDGRSCFSLSKQSNVGKATTNHPQFYHFNGFCKRPNFGWFIYDFALLTWQKRNPVWRQPSRSSQTALIGKSTLTWG